MDSVSVGFAYTADMCEYLIMTTYLFTQMIILFTACSIDNKHDI